MSRMVKAAENEKRLLATAVEVRDARLEDALARSKDMEAEIERLTGELSYFRKFKAQYYQMEQKVAKLQQQLVDTQQETGKMDEKLKAAQRTQKQAERERERSDTLLRETRAEIVTIQEERLNAITERNSLKTRLEGIAKELRRLVGPGRSVQDVEEQLKERHDLRVALSIERAKSKHLEDELSEYEHAVESFGIHRNARDQQIQQTLRHNVELQRLTQTLSSALSEKHNELEARADVNRSLTQQIRELTTKSKKNAENELE